ncbi:serine/threonine protein kinase [Pyxidicoccus parkwayensis]|uniref:Serine/threonine protein kinase n=1 Tax=Pyxidicoccus parkwayensis TaxID=2813578 RepID=A0ABX7P9J8_9BACT|nr:tetratricopeptide repeat protein [Pyxidicoccus parkwaysis]QSQ27111.1 serine/threonine protein kinase [Pyxidicoccus parkwaysis]
MSPTSLPGCLDETQLLDLADGVAPESLRASAEAHLDGCATCRELLAGFLHARAPVPSGSQVAVAPTQAVTTLIEDTRASTGPRIRTLERGTLLGRYVVLERLGAGGMGVVYAAYDPGIDRRIGLKLVQAAPGVEGATERLLDEARAAARTQHPHVVGVHDVGVAGDIVFIAMELVEGGTLRQHLAAHRRGWREVVRLYLQAGRGLAAAHAAGVVHRDFKPDNVLVDRTGRARVTDFGLARFASSTEAALPSPTSPGTDRGSGNAGVATSVAGTPGYIAPEVLAGGPVDARSDQYSFCVALYEGLYGMRPDAPGAREAQERASVPRAVHAAVERGLAPVPEERHASMDALLTTLERTVSPRAARFAGGLGAGIGVAAALASIFIARGPQPCTDSLQRLSGTWDSARGAALERTFRDSGLPGAASVYTAVRQSLDAYAAAWAGAHREACEATRVRGEQSEASMDLRMHCLERRKRELGATVDLLLAGESDAVLSAPKAVRGLTPVSACADVEALARPVPLPTRGPEAARVQAAYDRLAEALARDNAGRWQEAASQAASVAAEAEAVGYKPLLGEALLTEGRALQHLRQEKDAAARLRRAALASQAGRDDARAAEAFAHLVFVDGELAERPEQAELWRELAQSLLERIGGDDGLEATLAYHEGLVLERQGRSAEALPLLHKGLAMRERAYGKDHANLVEVLLSLATTQRSLGQAEEALATQQRARAILVRTFGPDHPYVAMTLNNIAGSYAALQRYDEALAAFAESMATFERAHGPGQPLPYILGLYGNMGVVHFIREDFEAARRTLEKGWRLAQEHRPPGHPDRASLAGPLALALAHLGRTDEALHMVDAIHAELDAAEAEGRQSVRNAELMEQEAHVLLRMRRFEQSASAARRAAVMLRALKAEDALAGALSTLGMALLGADHLAEAERVAREALSLREHLPEPQAAALAEPRAVLGQVLLERGDAARARPLLEQAIADWEKEGQSALNLAIPRFALARALRQSGADAARARALAQSVRETMAPTAEPRIVRLEELDAFLGVHSAAR